MGYGQRYYGYNWFSGKKQVKGESFNYVGSFGYGGQTLYLVPDQDLILVFMCELSGDNSHVDELVDRTFEVILK
jgi:hypothetical protein